MKNINKTILLLCILFMTYSCNEDDLSLESPNRPPADNFFQNRAQLQASVNAIYSNLQTQGLYNRHMFFAMDNMAHENSGNSQLEADKRQYLEFTFNADHGAIGAFWESCYRGIHKANYVINNQELIDQILVSELPPEEKNKFLGEAHFLRAFYYFILVTRFGDIPYIKEIPQSTEGFPIRPEEDIYNDIIIPDLEFAVANLYAKENTENGRATVGAAYALLGKVHLYRQEYQAAKDAFTNILGEYTLVNNYEENFLEETEHNEESIFEVEFDDAFPDTDKWNSDVSGAGYNEVTFRGQEYGWNDWFNVYPSEMLLDEYEDGDPRYDMTFYSNGDTFAGGIVSIPLDRVAAWRKYQNYYKDANEDQASGINMKVIRFADVLLMMAEVENELAADGGDALMYLNMVRDRVGMPNYGTPAMNATYPVTTKQERFEAIVHERMVELAGEQVRFPDLVRWGIAGDVLGQFDFQVGKHEHFPIPQREINSNDKVTNADQNNGY
ncbi:RagB/SusD family nutrient uptake outer membrane protein [Fulvivirga maritima]|uniref:RagB/SusD family nutrient uptake outer membrane protein n=1 Tax=Fulvivirga maritima TaxID=2904247 RepID=UPI001F4743D6|nr:RagB/SusD family nutrient uptake outer membrane protein [Fulvivirga maritima]UII25488.1 RagB/SusD family nutrient uptake outer membrane protein [Fulvivirga maritima]